MSDDLTGMAVYDGMSRAEAAKVGESRLFSRITLSTRLAAQPGCRNRPEAEPRRLEVTVAGPRAMPPGRLRPTSSMGELVGDRRETGPDPEIDGGGSAVLAGGHDLERGAGHAPGGEDPPQAVRLYPSRAIWRHFIVTTVLLPHQRRRSAAPQAGPAGDRGVQKNFRPHRLALALPEPSRRSQDQAGLTPLLEFRKISTANWLGQKLNGRRHAFGRRREQGSRLPADRPALARTS